MCARRFLYLIFFLTVIAVLGAFALFQFGDRVMTRVATPQGPFVAPPPATGPDYGRRESWIARPGMVTPDPSIWQPAGEPLPATAPGPKSAATFFIHPTTYLERDRWNAPLNPGGEASFRSTLFVQSQASAFSAVSDVWAPRYRQAAFGAFLLSSDDANQALNLAYGDVLKAFDLFLAEQDNGTALILAGHSQGALHLSRLLVERRDALKGRLGAAYVVGWPLSLRADVPAIGLSACETADQLGCVLSWQSFAEPANPSLVLDQWTKTRGVSGIERSRADLLCTNPLTGTRGGAAPPAANLGTLVPTADLLSATLAKGQVGARCEDGFLIIDGLIPALGPYVLPGNNYHVYDYALFWGSIRADVARRLAAFRR